MKLVTGVLCGLVGLSAFAANVDDFKVIYGDDNRSEVIDYRDRSMVRASRSTVALFKSSKLSASGDQFVIEETTFESKAQLCGGERFAKQPATAFCSGFLVAPNKIMTAGHCVTSHSDCRNVRLVFDYKMINQDRAQTVFTANQVYTCKKVIGWEKDDQGADFAVIELDRDVTDREPLKLATNKKLKRKTKVTVVGHPAGLPLKITDRASVRNILTSSGYFTANLDTYGGNSGSAVLNAKTYEVEGILVRGEKDYETDYASNCRVSYRVGENAGRGEDVTLISAVKENGGFAVVEESQISTPTTPSTPSVPGPGRYIWLPSDNTCNEFVGMTYIREVPNSYCPEASGNVTYVWLNSDSTCNEFRGNTYIREVADSLCGRSSTANMRYIWLSDNTCNLFNGNSYIREVSDELCGH